MPTSMLLLRKVPTVIFDCLRLSYRLIIACLILAGVISTSTSFVIPAAVAFQGTHPAFDATNRHHRQRLPVKLKHTSRREYFQLISMSTNEGSLSMAESEDTNQNQPVNKKLRPSPSHEMMTETPEQKGTFYITMGPQCAGKTTMLNKIFGKSFHKNEERVPDSLTKEEAAAAGVDITIDDQALVYIPVPASYFLGNSTSNNPTIGSSTNNSYLSLNEMVHGKTIHERIFDQSNEELRLVLQRLGGTLTAEEFALRLRASTNYGPGDKKMAQEDYINSVEQVLQSTKGESTNEQTISAATLVPETIDLFIVESIFRPPPLDLMQKMTNTSTSSKTTSLSAVDQALHLLKTHAANPQIHAPTATLSWGNTNTRPREFNSALEAAVSGKRPVEFIIYGGLEACEKICGKKDIAESDNDSEKQRLLLCLPKVDRKTLFVRNVQRLMRTGRYVPSNAIADAIVRLEEMLTSAVAAAEANKEHTSKDSDTGGESTMSSAKFRLDCELAKLAGYRMNADRTVSSIPGFALNSNNRNSQGNRNNDRRGRNNHQRGRGDDRNRQQSGRYNGGRGGDYRGRGGRSSSRSGSDWDNHTHDRHRNYNNPGNWQESDRGASDNYRTRRENSGRGSYYRDNDGYGHESSNRRRTGGRGWEDHNHSGGRDRQDQGRGRGRGHGTYEPRNHS